MIAAAFRFPSSFFKNQIFVFHGENGLSMMDSFCDIQDLEMHAQNVLYRGTKEDDDFIDEFYEKFTHRESISVEEIRRFFAIAPSICTMDELIECDNALETLITEHPDAIYRR